jgi:hypothetical protein
LLGRIENFFFCEAKRDGETHFVLQETRTPKQFAVYLLLVTCCLIAKSYEKIDESCTNYTSMVSSLPKAKKSCGENKHSGSSPLDHGYVVGIGDAR